MQMPQSTEMCAMCCTGGMPDLLLWCPALRKAKLSEVKGPRDSLSSQQRAWIAALLAGGVDCEVLPWPCGASLACVVAKAHFGALRFTPRGPCLHSQFQAAIDTVC